MLAAGLKVIGQAKLSIQCRLEESMPHISELNIMMPNMENKCWPSGEGGREEVSRMGRRKSKTE